MSQTLKMACWNLFVWWLGQTSNEFLCWKACEKLCSNVQLEGGGWGRRRGRSWTWRWRWWWWLWWWWWCSWWGWWWWWWCIIWRWWWWWWWWARGGGGGGWWGWWCGGYVASEAGSTARNEAIHPVLLIWKREGLVLMPWRQSLNYQAPMKRSSNFIKLIWIKPNK